VLFISGYSWDVALPPADPDNGVDFLQKPFTPPALLEKLANLLATARRAPPEANVRSN